MKFYANTSYTQIQPSTSLLNSENVLLIRKYSTAEHFYK